MNVILRIFSKKKNSTAVPSGSGVSYTGTLRDGCSIIKPIIGFAISRTTCPGAYNYAEIADFARKYFIQDWVWDDGLWWAYMDVDLMGSYKLAIGESECYILRSKTLFNGDLIDSMYPTKAYSLSQCGSIDTILYDVSQEENGTYVIGVMGKEARAGCVVYYALTPGEMQTFRYNLFDDNYMGVMEITAQLKKALVNPAQYIVSANWFPYDDIGGDSVNSIGLGWWDIPTNAKVITSFVVSKTQDFLIYAHTKAEEQVEENGSMYLFSAPYSSYTLTIPPFGEIELDPQVLAYCMETEGGSYSCTVHAILNTDLMTGLGVLYLYSDDMTGERPQGDLLAFKQARMCAPVQVGQATSDVAGAITNTASSAIGGAATAAMVGSNAVGAVVGVLGAVTGGVEKMTPRVRTLQVNGGMAVFKQKPVYTVKYTPIVDTNIDENGAPLCETHTINEMEGYIKTMNADITLDGATDYEQEQIRLIMDGGFFYE